MSDSLGNADFDVEAQESLLEQSSEEEICEAERSNSSSTCVHAENRFLRSCILVIHSTLLFKSRAHNYASSSSSAYSPIHISDIYEGSGADADSDDLPAASTGNIELQQVLLQRENVSEIVKTKNLELLRSFGGVRGVADALNTDLQNGIRIPNQTYQRKPTQVSQIFITFFHSFLESCNNCTVFLLACAAVLSIGFGIKEDGLEMGWFDGGVLLATVFIIVLGTTVRKCWEQWSNNKSQLGRKLDVQIVREGITHFIGEVDLVVGDITLVRKGDRVPADGLFVGGELQLNDGSINPTTIDESNPFMFYGSRVINGDGRMLITTTGVDTVLGEMMSQAANKDCNFECYLNKLFVCLHLSALLVSILIVVVLFLRYTAGKLDDERRYRPDSKGEPTQLKTFGQALKAITTGSKGTARVVTTLLSVSLLGIMEGIPLVISIATMIWSHKTLADNALESNPFACVNIKGLTTICTDIYGGMTERDFEFDKLYVGDHGCVSEIASTLVASQVVDALRDVIAAPCLLSATDHDPKLDHCLLSWAESELGVDRNLIEKSKMIIPHSRNTLLGQSQHNFQLTMEINGNRGYLHCKGHPNHILPLCSHHYGIDGIIREMDGEKKRKLEMDIGHMLVEEEAQVIAYACKHVVRDSSHEVSDQPDDDLAFLAMISMRKTKMEDIKEAVARLEGAGIRSILTSGEHVSVLKSIGEKCGLLTNSDDDGVVITGEEFRLLSDDDRVGMIEKICIVGNCTPGDKFLLIKCLKEAGQVVALVAQRTVDAPALKLADIGITYGGTSTSSEIARDCSDITVVDGKCCFGLIVKAVESGRVFFGNVRKFIQLQLIFGVSSSFINFIASVALGDAPITAVQLFWLSLVVPLAGGLALLTGSADASSSYSSEKLLITRDMWRNIGVQVCYQTGVLVALQHKGQDFLGTTGVGVKLIIYNAFFLCQAFNIFIAREPRKKNIFADVYHNRSWFWVALLLFTVCQAAFAAAEEFLGSTPGLHLKLWGVCLLIAFLSCPLDLAAKMLLLFLN